MQSLKQASPICFKLVAPSFDSPEYNILVRLLQDSKASLSKCVRVEGILRDFRLLHPLKAHIPIFVVPVVKNKLVAPEQFSNVHLSILFIDDGIDMLGMLEQPLNANSPIDSRVPGNDNFLAPLQFSKALPPIVWVPLGIIISGKPVHPLKEEPPILFNRSPKFKFVKLEQFSNTQS